MDGAARRSRARARLPPAALSRRPPTAVYRHVPGLGYRRADLPRPALCPHGAGRPDRIALSAAGFVNPTIGLDGDLSPDAHAADAGDHRALRLHLRRQEPQTEADTAARHAGDVA